LFGLIFCCFCFAATQLALQVQQERTQVVCSNRQARKRPAESNGTPAIIDDGPWTHEYCFEVVYVNRKNPRPPGGFLCTMFPNQEPGERGPFSTQLLQIRGGSLPPGS